MTTEYRTPSSEAEWLDWRKHDLTSTDIAALFDLSPYSTHFEVWHAKKNQESGSFTDNERMQAGRHIEPAIASLVGERYNVRTTPYKTYATDPVARLGSSFDFRITDATESTNPDLKRLFDLHGPGILECKNVDFLAHRDKWTADECPDHIEIQLQHQLELTDCNWGCIAALVGGNKIWLYIRERELEFGRAIRQKAAQFWASIDADEPPPPTFPDDADAVIAMHQYADPGKIMDARSDDALAELTRRYMIIGKEISALDLSKDTLKAQILEIINDSSKVFTANCTISAGQVADSAPTTITADMVGQTYGGRKGYRMLRCTAAKK